MCSTSEQQHRIPSSHATAPALPSPYGSHRRSAACQPIASPSPYARDPRASCQSAAHSAPHLSQWRFAVGQPPAASLLPHGRLTRLGDRGSPHAHCQPPRSALASQRRTRRCAAVRKRCPARCPWESGLLRRQQYCAHAGEVEKRRDCSIWQRCAREKTRRELAHARSCVPHELPELADRLLRSVRSPPDPGPHGSLASAAQLPQTAPVFQETHRVAICDDSQGNLPTDYQSLHMHAIQYC
ncbi:hypothetical protein OBBRIDRAFT_668768 [Obba rivulosa]|uniref:Uncharacterized protein n=1 Tax=Obba rivulosa TaxID=1052685 RepID=A0A8E2ARP6_9APHY|nr:hypothetical protein OBBRIDRAFT_668768 [Obba rivulosa]